jgi:ATP-dependent helicase Lhr and Lhr-like helicase
MRPHSPPTTLSSTSAERLHPALRYHVINTLEWPDLRPLQDAAIAPVMEGDDCLLLAPTAGGKTEAAMFPLLSRLAEESWRPLSVVYVCPLRALLNNLEPRLDRYCSWLGRRSRVWHGDTTAGARREVLTDRPDVLLTTPESLEAMLISARVDPRTLFGGLRAVVVDEVHSFLGDDRGWHLLAVLERLARLAGRPLQRIGLSATVGNPAELLGRLQGSGVGVGAASVVAPPAAGMASADVQLDYVGSLENAARVIAALHRGEKRLVFCDSRRRVEELVAALRQREVVTFLSHSSLSAGERRAAEQAFVEASDCVIVATSTLELGIDIGDLDRVIQIDAPATVAAFLQRLGRSGRRSGTARNCLLLSTDRDALLQAAGLLRLWRQGWVEPIEPPPSPLHILAQQVLALTLQEGRIGRRTWREWLGELHLASEAEIEAVVAHLLSRGFLASDQDMLHMGASGENSFGRRHFTALTSVFTTDPHFVVLAGRTEVGTVHPMALLTREGRPAVILLAGHSWQVTHIDWERHRCQVRPADSRGSVRWGGSGQPLSAELCASMRSVVLGAPPGAALSSRAESELEEVRVELADRCDEAGTVVVRDAAGRMRWWTWAGGRANASLAAALRNVLEPTSRIENLSLRIRAGVRFEDLGDAVRGKAGEELPPSALPAAALRGLKFSEALPESLAERVLGVRMGDSLGATTVLRHRIARLASEEGE